jgi:DNA-formamidopyrimidine glycosylase
MWFAEGVEMPEGPELAYSRDRLKKIIEGRSILELAPGISGRYSKKLPEGYEAINKLVVASPIKVDEIGTRGKFMWWRLQVPGDPEYWFMHCSYGMSGAWQTKPTKHTAFVVEYGTNKITRDSQNLYFNDARHFGTIKFVRGGAAHRKKLESLGPCILGGQVTPEIFAEKMLRKPALPICEAMMDQAGVSGIGNYLRAEILYDCGVDPWRNVTEITSAEYVKLCESTIRIAEASYKSQGATISTYRTVDDSKGTTQFDFEAYGRKECTHGHPITRRQDGNGRMVHWCPRCQA